MLTYFKVKVFTITSNFLFKLYFIFDCLVNYTNNNVYYSILHYLLESIYRN